jgi:hypothetical protein
MDKAKVLMLMLTTDPKTLPESLQGFASDPKWWAKLEATPEDSLTSDQLQVLHAPRQRRRPSATESPTAKP